MVEEQQNRPNQLWAAPEKNDLKSTGKVHK